MTSTKFNILVLNFLVLFALLSCDKDNSLEKYNNDKTYSLTISKNMIDISGSADGIHKASLIVSAGTTPEDESANFIETTCDFNHMLRKHHTSTAVYGIVGEFDSFFSPNEISFTWPMKLAYDYISPNSQKNYFYSDFALFRIPINEDEDYLMDSMLDEDSWELIPVEWTDTTIEDYTNPLVSCRAYITEINSLYTIGRLTKN